MTDEEMDNLIRLWMVEPGDLLYLLLTRIKIVLDSLGALRLELSRTDGFN